jgi:hypothetical protein
LNGRDIQRLSGSDGDSGANIHGGSSHFRSAFSDRRPAGRGIAR